jgi:hypothetical protein
LVVAAGVSGALGVLVATPAKAAPPRPPPPYVGVKISGSTERLTYRLTPIAPGSEESDSEDAGYLLSCNGDCELFVYPGAYRLQAEAPRGMGLRPVQQSLVLRGDTRVRVEPGDRSQQRWGTGLIIGGSIVSGFGFVFLAAGAMSGAARNRGAFAITAGLLGVGGATLASGIVLRVNNRNRVTLDPPPLREPRAAALHFTHAF